MPREKENRRSERAIELGCPYQKHPQLVAHTWASRCLGRSNGGSHLNILARCASVRLPDHKQPAFNRIQA